MLIIGSGALACLFAARLSRCGQPVTLTGTWEAGLTAIRNHGVGLVEEGQPQPAFFPVNLLEPGRSDGRITHALLLTKTYQTNNALNRVKPYLAENCVVLSLQNGLTARNLMANVIGIERTLSGVTTCGAEEISPGVSKHNGGLSVQIEDNPPAVFFDRVLSQAGFSVTREGDIRRIIWLKAIMNSAANPVGALVKMRNGEMLDDPELMRIMDDLIEEACTVASADGTGVDPGEMKNRFRVVMKDTANNRTSMLQDILNGRTTEIEEINGAIVELAIKYEVPVPVQQTITRLVRSLEKKD
jgi:2-dehydropantoate 2-reductase